MNVEKMNNTISRGRNDEGSKDTRSAADIAYDAIVDEVRVGDKGLKFANIKKFTNRIKKPVRPIEGRSIERASVLASFMRPELCNVMLLAEAGSGKTALVQSMSEYDDTRLYLEVDISKMISATINDISEISSMLKALFDEVSTFYKDTDTELVFFIDEFHQIVQVNDSAVEALKPILADSGTRGIRIIAATTYEEFNQFIRPNQALTERLQRISLGEPPRDVVLSILESMVNTYGVSDKVVDPLSIYSAIYDYTNRYLPSQSQPRKSIRILDGMIGESRFSGRAIDVSLLAETLYKLEGVNVSFAIDATLIEKTLNKHVFDQPHAIKAVTDRLHIATARLNNESKPMGSFLFTGATGTGKTELSKWFAHYVMSSRKNLIRFDMSEYALESSMNNFRYDLTAKVWARPNSVLLFDEIEKSCAAVTKLLLQVLDDGKLNDASNREVSFKNTWIIITTNLAAEVYAELANYSSVSRRNKADAKSVTKLASEDDSNDMSNALEELNRLVRASIITSSKDGQFPPELLGRIDSVVPFAPLMSDTKRKIVQTKIKELRDNVLEKHGVTLKMNLDLIVDFLVEEKGGTQTKDGGAREPVANLDKYVVSKVAKFINDNPRSKQAYLVVDGTMRQFDKQKADFTAKILVTADSTHPAVLDALNRMRANTKSKARITYK